MSVVNLPVSQATAGLTLKEYLKWVWKGYGKKKKQMQIFRK